MSEIGAVPEELRYSKDHEWVKIEGATAVVGVTEYAQHALGEITYADLPQVGKRVQQFSELAALESAKAASDVFSPVGGVVAEVNSALENAPDQVNHDPYGAGWICKLNEINVAELNNLLTASQYRELLKNS
jgi:glycine cleavage system H protein